MNAAVLRFRESSTGRRLAALYALTKPRVVLLIVFCAVIGMVLAQPGLPDAVTLLATVAGIGLAAGGAAAINCLVERTVDARMHRTRQRPLPRGEVRPLTALLFALAVGGGGLAVLWHWVNPLTMWLTLATFVGYALVYTLWLKPATPQNIVIGGASGAMPPVLGWAAATGTVGHDALLLFLIVFVWTPPHFWSLALYRRDDYARAGLPMLPVTHGETFTLQAIVLYTLLLAGVTLLPLATGMSGAVYLLALLGLNARFVGLALTMYRRYSHAAARRAFRFSIWYLTWLFAALLIDHYLFWPLP